MYKSALFVLIALLGAIPLAGLCKEPVQIALSVPLTGPFANVGETEFRHAQLYVEGINARGGVLGGRPLKFCYLTKALATSERLGKLRELEQVLAEVAALA